MFSIIDELTRDPSCAQIFEEHLFSVRVKKILEEVGDRLIGDVAAHHYVTPDANLKLWSTPHENQIVGCVTLAHRTSAHHFFGTSAHQYPDICSSKSGHLLIKIRTSAHQNPDICSSNFGHLLRIYRKVKVCLQDMSRVI